MNKQQKEDWQTRKDFEQNDIDLKPWQGLNVEHQNTPEHEFCKFVLSRVLYEKGRQFDSEVRFGNGREADIVDLGPEDGKPVVYEVETNLTPKRKREKLDHFYIEGLIRDVICIDPADVPTELHAAIEHIETEVVI